MAKSYTITKNIFYNFVAQFILFGLSFISAPFIIHTLGNELYGIMILVGAVLGYFALLDFGLGVSLIKYLSEYYAKDDKEMVQKVIWNSFLIYILIGSIGASLIFIFAKSIVNNFLNIPIQLIPLAVSVFYISAIGFFVNLVLTVFNTIPNALQRMDISNSRNVLMGFLNTLGTVLLLAAGYGLIEIVFWNILVSIIGTLILYKDVTKLLPELSFKISLDKKIMLSLLKFSGFKFLGNVAGQIVFQLDKLILGFFHPISAVTFYSVPANLVQKNFTLFLNITNAVFPALSESYSLSDLKRSQDLYLRMSKFTSFVVLGMMVIFFIFADKIMFFWLGREFMEQSALTLRILAPAYFIASLSAPGVIAVDAFNKPQIATFFACISAAIHLVFGLLLIPRYGVEGAAITLLINFICQVPIFVFIVNKSIVKVSNREYLLKSILRPIFAAFLSALISISLLLSVKNDLFELISGLVIFSISYIVINYLLGTFDDRDKLAIRYIMNSYIFKKR